MTAKITIAADSLRAKLDQVIGRECVRCNGCLLYTSDAADERSSVDLGGRRLIKKKNKVDKI